VGKPNRGLEMFGENINSRCDNLPKGTSRCFNIGTWGGCGVACAAFYDGECSEPQEISVKDIADYYDEEDCEKILSQYDCFKDKRIGQHDRDKI